MVSETVRAPRRMTDLDDQLGETTLPPVVSSSVL